MRRILFLAAENTVLPEVAADIAAGTFEDWQVAWSHPGTETRSPGSSESGTNGGCQLLTYSLSDAPSQPFDIVVQIGKEPLPSDIVFARLPLRVRWPLEELGNLDLASMEKASVQRKVRRILDEKIRKLFSDRLVDAAARLRLTFSSLIDHLTDGVLAHDKHRRIFLFNRPAEMMTGYNAEDVIGRDCHEVFPGRFCGGDCSFCLDTSGAKTRLRYPNRFVKPDGEMRDLEMSVVPLDTPDRGILGALVIFRDTTEINALRRKTRTQAGFHGMIGSHPAMTKVYDAIEELARVNVPILIQGESGTGKEMVAKALHELSPRANKPFVPVNCGALPEGILESELFGHVRGAFTGAIRDKKGRFELADGGILFLDEIGEISPGLQVKLLRVLQENRFTPVGGERVRTVDVRVICATNRDLKEMIRNGEFREDLFYRIAVVPIRLPALKDRASDIPALIDHYLEQVSREMGASQVQVAGDALDLLMKYNWPGNVRELRNAVQYGIIKTRTGSIEIEHLPPEIRASPDKFPGSSRKPGRPSKLNIEEIRHAMEKAGGNKAKAARILGVSRTTLYKSISELNLADRFT